MTLEEAQAKLAELTEKLSESEKASKQLAENVSKQNSYITKLETEVNKAKQNRTTPSDAKGFDPTLVAYLEKNIKRDATEDATKQIIAEVGEEVYATVEKEFTEFLTRNLTKENATTAYVIDAFSLVMGRALRNKDHAINKIGKGSDTPPATPSQQSNSNAVKAVQDVVANYQTPPVMTAKDSNAAIGSQVPGSDQAIKNTKESFKSLREKLAGVGSNPFQ